MSAKAYAVVLSCRRRTSGALSGSSKSACRTQTTRPTVNMARCAETLCLAGSALRGIALAGHLFSATVVLWPLLQAGPGSVFAVLACCVCSQFALASLLLGVLLLMSGGTEHLELQLTTLDEESYLK